MKTEGLFAPETREEARTQYETVASGAGEVVRAVATSMSFDREEYGERVTDEVVDTAREAMFASLLEVTVGTREEFEQWSQTHEYAIFEIGGDNVNNVVWHAAPFAETVVAATFQNEREAAVGTLRRQAFGRIYSEVLQ